MRLGESQMNEGDIVRVKQQFHRPSRAGQLAKIIRSRSIGVHKEDFQHWVIYQSDGMPDWLNEYDLELVEESHEFDEVINEPSNEKIEEYKEAVYNPNPYILEKDGKQVLNL